MATVNSVPTLGRLNVETGELASLPMLSRTGLRPGAISPDGETLYVKRGQRKIVAINLTSGHERDVYVWTEDLGMFSQSPDGRWLAVDNMERGVLVVGVDGRDERVITQQLGRRIQSLIWTRDGRGLLAVMGDRTLRIDIASGAVEPAGIPGFAGSLSPDGSRVVTRVVGGRDELWAIDNVSAFLKATK